MEKRFAEARGDDPLVLYVDKDCCAQTGVSRTNAYFRDWRDLIVRLDIFHFMRRISSACTTDAHLLYAPFMAKLSECIFVWDEIDYQRLNSAKKSQLKNDGISNINDEDVARRLSRTELALHCRRKTRGVPETQQLIQKLLEAMSGPSGRDTMGIPLLDSKRVWQVWENQKKHLKCIQDPENIQLYTSTGSRTKGGIEVPTYRCARGST